MSLFLLAGTTALLGPGLAAGTPLGALRPLSLSAPDGAPATSSTAQDHLAPVLADHSGVDADGAALSQKAVASEKATPPSVHDFLSADDLNLFLDAYNKNAQFNHWLNLEEVRAACGERTAGVPSSGGKSRTFDEVLLVVDDLSVALLNQWLPTSQWNEEAKKWETDHHFKLAKDLTENFDGDCMIFNTQGGGHWSRVVLEQDSDQHPGEFRLVAKNTAPDGMCGAHAAFGRNVGGASEYYRINTEHFGGRTVEQVYMDFWRGQYTRHKSGEVGATHLLEAMVEGMLREVVVDRTYSLRNLTEMLYKKLGGFFQEYYKKMGRGEGGCAAGRAGQGRISK